MLHRIQSLYAGICAASSSQETLIRNPSPLSIYPGDLQTLMARIGPIWGRDMRHHRNLVWDAFEPLLAGSPRDGVAILADLAYGDHPRQVLDVYRPANVERGGVGRLKPVVVFAHGGAFVRGERNVNAHGYGNMLTWFAHQGYVGINMEYRLAPEARYPAGADDVARVVAWVRQHAEHHGGDPERIFLLGHSAGGTHVATYAYDPAAGYGGKDVRGIALVSARLRADRLACNPNASGVEAYFGANDALLEVRSPVVHAHESDIPTFIAIAEFENPLLDVYGAEMLHRLAVARGFATPFLRLAGHNHISIVAHFNTGEEILGREIVDFFESVA